MTDHTALARLTRIRQNDANAGERHHFQNKCCQDRRFLLGLMDEAAARTALAEPAVRIVDDQLWEALNAESDPQDKPRLRQLLDPHAYCLDLRSDAAVEALADAFGSLGFIIEGAEPPFDPFALLRDALLAGRE